MEQGEKTPADQAREEYFDQSVDELKQLESEQERKPNNKKIRAYVEQTKVLLDKLLSELDEEEFPRESAKDLGSQALGVVGDVSAKGLERKTEVNTSNATYADSQGFVHSTPEEARASEPEDWRKTSNL